jgi:hypothetical protein
MSCLVSLGSEVLVYPSFMAGVVNLTQFAFLAVSLALPPLAWVMRKVCIRCYYYNFNTSFHTTTHSYVVYRCRIY